MSDAVATAQQGLVEKYQPYPEYKDSGVEWLGDVPTDWRVIKLGFLATKIGSGKTPSGGATVYVDDGITFLRSQNVYDDGLRLDDVVHITPDVDIEMAHSRVKPMDILINITGASIGRTCIVPLGIGSANVNQHVCIIRLNKSEIIRFVSWAVKAQSTKAQIDNAQTGAAREGMNFEQIASLLLSLPPETECEQISDFLDYETARIDRLIAHQQRLIELLKEKRQALISHAVTKGLNPKAPMKDSGVEWLGQVPEHWQCVPFGLLVSRADLGGNYLGGQEENGIPFLKMGNLGRGCIVLDKLECLEEGSSFDDAHRLSMGDFLFNTRNSLDLVGKVAVWHDELEYALYNSNLLRVRFKKDFISSPDFMGFVFNSSGALGWLALLAKGTTSVAAIYYKDLRSMVVPIPPVDEQNAISSFISKCLSRLDTLEEKAIQSINLMNERRTALISAAVTGKIDLRGWTPPAEKAAA
ncbi:Type-1 restriction enzyme EcoKI specificity protein [compost metagenome]